MSVSKEQAVEANEFHYGECHVETGPRGGKTEHIIRYRRMGRTKLWKARPDDFRVPVKFGMRAHDSWYITPENAHEFHTADECPLTAPVAELDTSCDELFLLVDTAQHNGFRRSKAEVDEHILKCRECFDANGHLLD